jgi:hydrogenase maturation protease
MADTLVIGVGSPQGDDRVAWAALEQLANHPQVRAAGERVAFEALDRPGAAMIGRWQGAHKVVLIDAVRSGAPLGTLHCLSGNELLTAPGTTSSHGFGVAETIQLARALGALPPELVILGIEAGAVTPGEPLSLELRQALPALIDAAAHAIS